MNLNASNQETMTKTNAISAGLEDDLELEAAITFPSASFIDPKTLGNYLLEIQENYDVLQSIIRTSEIDEYASINDLNSLANYVTRIIEEGLYFPNIRCPTSFLLQLRKITFNSPLELLFYGFGPALLLALIVSGGKISTPLVKIELKPLGDGISKLRSALRKAQLKPNTTRTKKPEASPAPPSKSQKTQRSRTQELLQKQGLDINDIPAFLRKQAE